MKITVIIPTLNSMPAFKKTLESIKKEIPIKNLEEILVIDKNSTDNTVKTANDYKQKHGLPIQIIKEEGTLGLARMRGLQEAKTEWIAFIDSDVELCREWYGNMTQHISNDTGWVVGRLLDTNPLIQAEQLYRRNIKTHGKVRLIKKGERAFTHNTLCRRKPLLEVNISHMNAWEDYVLSQAMLSAGYKVKQIPINSLHIKDDKINEYEEAWSIPGIIKTKGRVYAFIRMFYWMWWGFRTAIHFRNLWYLNYHFRIFLHQFHAFLKPNRFFESKRGDK